MKLDFILLSLLARKPYSGYELGVWLASDGRFIRSNTDMSQIYRTLTRLADSGHVCFKVEDPRKGPQSKIYSLTASGLTKLFKYIDKPYEPPTRFNDGDFFARFTCGGIVKPESLLPLIDTELQHRREQIRRFRHRERTLEMETDLVPINEEFAKALFDDAHFYNAELMDNWIKWLVAERARLVDRLAKAGLLKPDQATQKSEAG